MPKTLDLLLYAGKVVCLLAAILIGGYALGTIGGAMLRQLG